MNDMWILAQANSQDASSRIGSEPVPGDGDATVVVPDGNDPGVRGTPQRSPFSYQSILFMVVIFGVMYMLLLRGPRKQQQQHKQMLQSLKKNDRVRTIGGIYGTIVDIRGEEIVLKVDESNNTKIRVSASAISKNLAPEGKE